MKLVKGIMNIGLIVFLMILSTMPQAVEDLFWQTQTFAVNPSSKICVIPQDGVSTTCDITFNWTVGINLVSGTFTNNRNLEVGGVQVTSQSGNGIYTAQIPIGSFNYQLTGTEPNLALSVAGTVSADYGNYTTLFAHNSTTHNAIAGDFDGNGEEDIYYQPILKATVGGIMPVVANDFLDSSFHKAWTISHPEISAIEDWSEESYGAYKGNFNANPGDELLLLGTKQIILLHGDIITPIAIFQSVNNAIVSWNGSHVASHVEFEFDANPADYVVHVGDLTGDGFDEILLQGKLKGQTSYILNNTGALIQALTSGYLNIDWSAAAYSAQISGGKIILSALTSADDNNEAYTSSSGAVNSLKYPVTKISVTRGYHRYAFQDTQYSSTPVFYDSSGDVIFSATGMPAWLNLNVSTGELKGIPRADDVNQSYAVTLNIHDEHSHTLDISVFANIEVVESFQISQANYSVYGAVDGTFYLVSSDQTSVYKIIDDNGVKVLLKSSVYEMNNNDAILQTGFQVDVFDDDGDGNLDLVIKSNLGLDLDRFVLDNISGGFHRVTVIRRQVIFIHTDLLGSPSVETNENGEIQ